LQVTAEWVNRLRNLGYPAYLSGAGPTIMVLSTNPVERSLVEEAQGRGMKVLELDVAGPVTVEVSG